MTSNANHSGYLNVRMRKEERMRLQEDYQRSTCRSVSEYVRHVLFAKRIVYTTRNQSLDDAVAELSRLRTEVNAIGKNINQAVKILHVATTAAERKYATDVLDKHLQQFSQAQRGLQQHINQIAGVWLQKST